MLPCLFFPLQCCFSLNFASPLTKGGFGIWDKGEKSSKNNLFSLHVSGRILIALSEIATSEVETAFWEK